MGRHRGRPSAQKPLVIRILRDPSTFMTQMSPSCSYAMRVRSGDQLGAPAGVLGLVRRVGFEPSALITQTAKLVSRSDWNAIFVPSGDHVGRTSFPGSFVTLTCPEPSAFIT